MLFGETSAEVAGGGRIGDAFGPQGVEERLLLAELVQVLQALVAGQEVVGDVEHVVGLVVGQVDLEQVELAVDALHESAALGQEVDGSDAAAGDAAIASGKFVMDIGASEDRLIGGAVIVADAACDTGLAGREKLV